MEKRKLQRRESSIFPWEQLFLHHVQEERLRNQGAASGTLKEAADFWSYGTGETKIIQSLPREWGPDKHLRLSLMILGRLRNNNRMYN